MNQDGRVANTTTVILVEGTSNEGEKIEMEIPIPHQAGVHKGLIINGAIRALRESGGMLLDNAEGGIDFYPLLSVRGRIRFTEKRVVLSTGPSSSPRVSLQ